MVYTAALLFSAMVWAFSYFPIVWLLGDMSAPAMTAVRFLAAGVVMLTLRPRAVADLGRREWRGSVLLALLLSTGSILQAAGLRLVSPAVSGFVATLYVVLTPVVAWLALGRRATPATWVAALVATLGAAVLSLNGLAVDLGVLLTLGGALAYACHFVTLSEVSVREHVYGITAVQMFGAGLLGLAWAGATTGVDLPHSAANWGWLAFTVLAATVLTFTLQTWAQGRVAAARAAVILTAEPVFVVAFTPLVGGIITGRALIGGAIIVAAVAIVEAERALQGSTKVAGW